jgi:Ca-activated chloride channel family protein
MTDAKYFRATNLESLKDIYEQIDLLEKSEVRILDHSHYSELFYYFLIPGLLLLVTEIFISNSVLRRIP